MLKFYVSCRPIQIGNYIYDPRDQLRSGFKGLDITHTLMASNRNNDGRYLYEIVIGLNSSYTDQQCLDYQAILIEGLSAWSCHLKTLASAQALAQELTGVTYNIVGDSIVGTAPLPSQRGI